MGAHLDHRMHEHSLKAYAEEERKLGKRAQAIYDRVKQFGPHTDRELAAALGFGENLNAVRPRVTELIAATRLMELAPVRDPVTGKTVRRVDIRRARQQLLGIAQ